MKPYFQNNDESNRKKMLGVNERFNVRLRSACKLKNANWCFDPDLIHRPGM
jgi:hypothetical protein